MNETNNTNSITINNNRRRNSVSRIQNCKPTFSNHCIVMQKITDLDQ